ncbi:unnamed protein product [Ilex paraguariensis]|uniref:E3 ubiquitin-protein ligase RMA n=1 Tax=Ilex paraguariensis TaxID=185542 RepID=A0ABC8TKG8_9AQUA
MGDNYETPNIVNLDLNVRPDVQSSPENEPGPELLSHVSMNLEDFLDGPVHRLRDAGRQRRQRWRSLRRQIFVPPETRNMAMEVWMGMQIGEGSVAAEERPTEAAKVCDDNNLLEREALGKKEDDQRGNGNEGSFFDCSICLDLARDPVVTCCGHLFCWPCIYRWLHVHSDAKECPVCKGAVTIKNVTPIYGRANNSHEPELDSNTKIPHRPQARRVESWRETIQRAGSTVPMEEMIRHLGRRFDWTQDLMQVEPQNPDGPLESPERSSSFVNRYLTTRGMHGEQNMAVPPDDLVDLTQSNPTNFGMGENRSLSSPLYRRPHLHRSPAVSNLVALSSDERLTLPYLHASLLGRNQEQPPPTDNRESLSSIAAVILSEIQTLDTAGEIDSRLSFSTSSPRRRNDSLRVSEGDSVDSRAPRRRRFN